MNSELRRANCKIGLHRIEDRVAKRNAPNTMNAVEGDWTGGTPVPPFLLGALSQHGKAAHRFLSSFVLRHSPFVYSCECTHRRSRHV